LNQDNYGKTALQIAIAGQSPKSFDLMIELLKGFDDICITKQMLKSMPFVLASE